MKPNKISTALIVCLFVGALFGSGVAQDYPKAKTKSQSNSRAKSSKPAKANVAERVIALAQAGDAEGVLALCDSKLNNGRKLVPAEGHVDKFIKYAKRRSFTEAEKAPKIGRFRFFCRNDGSFLVIKTKRVGGKRLVTEISSDDPNYTGPKKRDLL